MSLKERNMWPEACETLLNLTNLPGMQTQNTRPHFTPIRANITKKQEVSVAYVGRTGSLIPLVGC